MPSSSAVQEQLTDILVRVVGCPAGAVVPDAVLKDLGTDSLTIVEVGEELGRRFDLYLSDEAIDKLVTVNDAIRAVVRHDGTTLPRGASVAHPLVAGLAAPRDPAGSVLGTEDPDRNRGSSGFVTRFVLVGVLVGAILGIAAAALFSATGIGSVNLAPIAAPSTPAPTASSDATSTPTFTPTPTPTTTTELPDPSIESSSARVAAGDMFTLSGTFPGSSAGEPLQVEVRDDGADWDNFPIEPVTGEGGSFTAEIYTSRTGTREFRVTNTQTDVSTPPVSVEIS